VVFPSKTHAANERKQVVPCEERSPGPDVLIVRHEMEAACLLLAMHLTRP
jgi:hypothetical protein